jgi:hypothetical protein
MLFSDRNIKIIVVDCSLSNDYIQADCRFNLYLIFILTDTHPGRFNEQNTITKATIIPENLIS